MQALKAAQLMGNIPEAIFKHFFRKMAFHVCSCRFPFTPSTHPPQFQNDEILCFYTSKYRTSLVFCSAAQTLGQRGPSPLWNVRSQERVLVMLFQQVWWRKIQVIFPLGCFQAFPDALPFVRPVVFQLPPFLELSLQLCDTEGGFDTVTNGFQPAKIRKIHLL